MYKKTPPSTPQVQQFAKKWKDLANALTGGDPGVEVSLAKMYEQPGYENRYGVNLEMLHYIRDSLASLSADA